MTQFEHLFVALKWGAMHFKKNIDNIYTSTHKKSFSLVGREPKKPTFNTSSVRGLCNHFRGSM